MANNIRFRVELAKGVRFGALQLLSAWKWRSNGTLLLNRS